MKIAIITSGFLPVIDGVTVSGFQRVQRLSKWGHEVILFCPDYQSLKAIYPDWKQYTGNILPNVKVVNLESQPFMGIDFERNVTRGSYGQMLQQLEAFSPDIIHVDEPERLFLGFLKIPGIDFAKKHNIPCIGFFRTNFTEYIEDFFPVKGIFLKFAENIAKKLIAWIYNSYDLTLIHSKTTEAKLVQMGITNVHYRELWGFDPQKFREPKLKINDFFVRNYDLHQEIEEKVKILFIGRLTPDKGWDFGLNALEQFKDLIDWKRVAIFVAGDGPLNSEILERLSKICPETHMLGRVPPEKVPQLFANTDIYVTNSEKENRALTVVEALASGTPVIAPNAGGVIDNMTDGKTGFLYPPQDAQAFVLSLKHLVEHDDLRHEMADNTYGNVCELTLDKAVENLLDIWKKQVSENI
ncbi:glycosyl transferase family 1 [Picosynechococcus sp. PCC 7003]|uniref:glycosyltransferase n=1 Tax=Picosynechococcus sp. PCC 7003 TaxID=374981 RepID=UPI000810AD95|nr:glycosyltransferase [Picosynechococcus sp. PCC 7003]ANV84455.1 glycosyl transferase family 1 [Picosynechococcus sp. PCC 7003]